MERVTWQQAVARCTGSAACNSLQHRAAAEHWVRWAGHEVERSALPSCWHPAAGRPRSIAGHTAGRGAWLGTWRCWQAAEQRRCCLCRCSPPERLDALARLGVPHPHRCIAAGADDLRGTATGRTGQRQASRTSHTACRCSRLQQCRTARYPHRLLPRHHIIAGSTSPLWCQGSAQHADKADMAAARQHSAA